MPKTPTTYLTLSLSTKKKNSKMKIPLTMKLIENTDEKARTTKLKSI